MFGIKVKNEFLDLAQAKFSVVLKNPLWFDSGSNNAIPTSMMLSTRVKLTPKNKRLLQKPDLLTNSDLFLKNSPAEIHADGSAAFRGTANVTEATHDEAAVSVYINSAAALKDFDLTEIQYLNPSGNAMERCVDAAYGFDSHPFVCPIVWNPTQWGDEVKNFGQGSYQNYFNGANFETSSGGSVMPFVRFTEILRGAIDKIGHRILTNHIADSQELRQLFLYYPNPINERGSNTLRWLNLNLARHVPKMPANEMLKQVLRYLNMGLFVDSFENAVSVKRADSVLDSTPLDWTRRVLKSYTITEDFAPLSKVSMPLPEVLSDMYSTPIFETYPNELKPAIYRQPDGSLHYLKYYDESPTLLQRLLVEFNYSQSLTTSSRKMEFETEVRTLPQATLRIFRRGSRNDVPAEETIEFFPAAKMQNYLDGNPKEYKTTLLLHRGGVFASSEAMTMRADGLLTEPMPSVPIKVGVQTSDPDNRPNANIALQMGGTNGIYNRFWKRWADFLKTSRIVDFMLILSIREVRSFSFDRLIYIGNQVYLPLELTIEFTENGIGLAKGRFLQL